jgi:hypothetical protein
VTKKKEKNWCLLWSVKIFMCVDSTYFPFEITVYGVPKLEKQYPKMANYLPHFAEA